jgi:hypothetical protein
MGPVSAVAIFIFLFLYGLNEGKWITASGRLLGVIAIIVGLVILIDTFWYQSSARWAARHPNG